MKQPKTRMDGYKHGRGFVQVSVSERERERLVN